MDSLIEITTFYLLAFLFSFAVGTALENVIVLLKGSVKVDPRSPMDKLFDGGVVI
jgi:hypothetical protein